ncbi:serine threonine- phosphatase CPPED1 [Brachionus plicatilis]|uniref:Serine threonine-phosphatase CPPED1 n=1 Tax=Brachionus plicatilis TaxID=10195 RepID=A0A3M7P8V4_BRAPC|nr:serine threonine- phosphatase CPPED1 [Brachionus plicatilis]
MGIACRFGKIRPHGDLVDAFPDQTEMRTEQVRDLKETLGELNPDIKLVCVCGNHDIGDRPTEQTIQVYKDDFGDDYFSFWCQGCKFIALNSQLYFDSSLCPSQKAEQDAWLDAELSPSDCKHKIIFQHIPLFVDRPDEAAHVYFNIEPGERLRLMNKFIEAGVSTVFCGHYHQNAGGFYQQLECVVTSAVGAQLGSDGHGYRLVRVSEEKVEHKFVKVTDQIN